MDNKQHQQSVQEAVKDRFKGRKEIKSRSIPHYPTSAEREFRRVTGGYIRLFQQCLRDHLPAIMDGYKSEYHRKDARFDASQELESKVHEELLQVAAELEQKLAAYGLDRLVEKIAKLTETHSLREWKRVCKDTLGIDLLSDYYNADFYEEAIRRWVSENVQMIKSIPNETLGEMREIILDGFKKGKTATDISKELQKSYGITKRKAQSLARDQIATLNAEISELQQRDAGCTKYKWSTSKDRRVRDCHRELDGKIFSWDNPPEMWYETKAGRVYTGRRCHPGQDFLCRCCAIPVFDFDTVDVPISGEREKGV